MWKPAYLALIIAAALMLRLYPALISGLPYSTDAWPLMRNTELLLQHTPIELDSRIFDGYNNYWPAVSLYSAVYCEATGVGVKQAMALTVPTVGSMTVLLFYALVKRLYGPWVSLAASAIYAAAYTHVILTAGVTKETYANPLYMLLILAFTFPDGLWKRFYLFTVASVALALTHHLTSLMATSILAFAATADFTLSLKRAASSEKSSFLFPAALALTVALYSFLYAKAGFKFSLALSDWLSAASYMLLALAAALYFAFKPSGGRRTAAFTFAAAAVLPLLFAVLAYETPITPGAPVLSIRCLLYAVPFIVASPFASLGYGWLKNPPNARRTIAFFWLAAVLGLEGYAVFGGSELGLTLAYRGLNFLWPPLAILCSAGLYRLRLAAEKHGLSGRRLMVAAASITVAALALINIYSVYAAVHLQERYLGYFWLNKPSEYGAAEWTAAVCSGQTVAGDAKASYLLKGYFNVDVDVAGGLRYLADEGSKPKILMVYEQMSINGYVLYGGYSVDLPKNWTGKLQALNMIYSNIHVKLYSG